MSEFKKVLFIINKYSGTSYKSNLEGRIIETCARYNTECTITYTMRRGHATELAKKAIGNYDAILAVGGDGTVNEVAQALVFTSTPMGILPKGSGNGLARHLHIPLVIEKALESFFTGTLVLMDTFRLNGYLSVNVSGIGFDGYIANLFDGRKKRGIWGYLKLILHEYFHYPEFDWVLQTENNATHFKSFIIALANSSQYGNNAFVAPRASVTDGYLNLSIAHKIPLYRGLPFVVQLFTKKLKDSDLFVCHTVQHISITSPDLLAFHVDGEPCGHAKSFVVEPLPRSLKIITPNNKIN